MPSQRFFNLRPEKQQVLVRAAVREFARVAVSEASINRIVQDAGISRGSFYTYFTDKEDLLLYVLQRFRQTVWQQTLTALKASGGDLFAAALQAYDAVMRYCAVSENRQFFQRFFSDIHITTQDTPQFLRRLAGGPQNLTCFLRQVDTAGLRLENIEDLYLMLELLVLAVTKGLTMAVGQPSQPAAARRQLLRCLDYLRLGMRKAEPVPLLV